MTIKNDRGKMATSDQSDDSLYPIAVLIDELRNEDVQVGVFKNILTLFFLKKLFIRINRVYLFVNGIC